MAALPGVLALCWMTAAPAAQAPPPAGRSFAAFLDELKAEALARGISEATIERALADLALEPVVVARDRAQPEQVVSLESYVARRVSAQAAALARQHARTHRDLLARVADTYGVPPAIVTAIWGLESSFGRFTGTYPTIQALATLAYDGRRPIFRAELLHALTILERGDVPVERLRGSWAGAMGQPQFLPSSYLDRAVDFDEDGRTDIWSSMPDVFASMANYLKMAGWTAGQRWGREVTVPRAALARIERTVPMRSQGCRAARAMTAARPLADWRALGITLPGGAPLPSADLHASLVRGQRRSFLVYRNYEALLAYNCSHSYAVSVGLLADRIPAD